MSLRQKKAASTDGNGGITIIPDSLKLLCCGGSVCIGKGEWGADL